MPGSSSGGVPLPKWRPPLAFAAAVEILGVPRAQNVPSRRAVVEDKREVGLQGKVGPDVNVTEEPRVPIGSGGVLAIGAGS